nr:MAG TPA_asm: hypothetical protein [Caudoviricetes sp.]
MNNTALDQIFYFFSQLLTYLPGLIRRALSYYSPSATSI